MPRFCRPKTQVPSTAPSPWFVWRERGGGGGERARELSEELSIAGGLGRRPRGREESEREGFRETDVRPLARVRRQVGIVNGCFWGTYGLAIADIYVYGPNLVGAAIAAVTSLVWFIYRVK